MAESIVSDLLGRVLGHIIEYGVDKIASYFGGMKKLNELRLMMRMIQARLYDAEMQRETEEGELIKTWLKELKCVLYQLQDLFEEFTMVEELKGEEAQGDMTKAVRCFPCSKLSVLKMNKKVSQEALDIISKLEQVTATMNMFNFNAHPIDNERRTMNMMNWREQTNSFIIEEEVIGRDEENKFIVEMLLESDHANKEKLSVIPIVGMGGLGKTTLAQLAYNHKIVQQHFELKCWASISDGISSFEDLVLKVVKSVTGCEDPKLGMSELLSHLRNVVSGKKFLLVLDDVWDEDRERWVKLKSSLSVGNPGSKILVTTRSEVVASNMGTVQRYKLEGLAKDKSWALFKSLAFREGQLEKNPNLASIGEEVVEKCGNVPLAIRTIAGILYSKETEEEWLFFKDKGIGMINQRENNIMPTLKLSYDHLPPPLKQCFAYCSLFVEDFVFDIEMLIRLWIAQGFVVSENEEGPYDVGYSYFMLLLRRCFFQDVQRDPYGRIVSFKMHDLMHELSKKVEDECLLVHSSRPRPHINDSIKHVHLILQEAQSWCLSSPQIQSLRTVFILSSVKFESPPLFNTSKLFSHLRRVRALHFGDNEFESLPDSIGDLRHLRYLQVRVNCLPNAITKLQRLEALDLRGSQNLRELPIGFHKLTTLRHLWFSDYWHHLTEMPPRFGELKFLQVLDKFTVGENNGLDALFGMNLIRDLTIHYDKHRQSAISEAKRANLKDKRLSSLTLWVRTYVLEKAPIDVVDELLECLQPPRSLKSLIINNWAGQRFPSWGMDDFAHLFPNLVHIKFFSCEKWKEVAFFSQLQHLKSLELSFLKQVEYIEVLRGGSNCEASSSTSTCTSYAVSTTYFPCLEILSLCSMPKLKGWSKKEYVDIDRSQRHYVQKLQQCLFPRLSDLTLVDCPELKSLPATEFLFQAQNHNLLQLYTSLRKLTLSGCDELDLWKFKDSDNDDEVRAKYLNSCFWKCLNSLTYLKLEGMSKLVLLPSGIGDLTALEELRVINLPNLRALSENIGNLIQLKQLVIWKCAEMESLPKSIHNLTTIEHLSIGHCPKLESKYRKHGDEWLLIQHISKVTIRNSED